MPSYGEAGSSQLQKSGSRGYGYKSGYGYGYKSRLLYPTQAEYKHPQNPESQGSTTEGSAQRRSKNAKNQSSESFSFDFQF